MKRWKLAWRFWTAALKDGDKVLPGEVAFKLHDTYGFPLDLTADVCRERGVEVDEAGFDAAMDSKKPRPVPLASSRWTARWTTAANGNDFIGYEQLARYCKNRSALRRRYAGYRAKSRSKRRRGAGHHAVLRRERRPGGRRGRDLAASAQFEVHDTQKIKADVFGHHGVLSSGS